ncbi:transmembrane protein 154 isoform X1 [Anoplopoma fimbria]|uniref:transmembrane protein 154 isoform X1 n=1 Tax=Anoplopoma fimbria TaxID=229290 RepID=UPI0023EDF5DF|nr:transmembrane protein 154 isoform X1 [Anoplopoma fimbria]
MFASGTGSMRGPRMKTPLLLLLLLLLTTLTRTVLCQYEDDSADPELETEAEEAAAAEPEEEGDTEISETPPSEFDATLVLDPIPTEEETEITNEGGHGSGLSHTEDYSVSTVDPDVTELAAVPEEGDEELSSIIILIPVVLVVIIISMIVCGFFINRKLNQKARNQELRKEDPYLDGSSTEKVPMPMFEEDVPSVLELEMEELDQWMRKDCEPADDSKLA